MAKAKRDYQQENKYKAKPEQIAARVERNKARAMMIKAGKAKVGDGKEVDHKVPISHGGKTTMSNLRVVSASENDSFKRNSKKQLVSQTSDREAKRKKK
jgi:5-methylcytosine-specific restriction endonuclease McrA